MTKEEAKEFIVQSVKDNVDIAKLADAIKSLENEEKLLKENRALKNRCKASTGGLLCSFCPLECEQRAGDYRGK